MQFCRPFVQPKSASFTRLFSSSSKFRLFRSLCSTGMGRSCRQFMPRAVSSANRRLSSQDSSPDFCSMDQRVPPSQYYSTMAKLGGLVHAPKNMTILGCRNAYIAWHSLTKSLIEFQLLGSILKILTATVVFLHTALQIIPYPPQEICLPSCSSSKGISMELSNFLAFVITFSLIVQCIQNFLLLLLLPLVFSLPLIFFMRLGLLPNVDELDIYLFLPLAICILESSSLAIYLRFLFYFYNYLIFLNRISLLSASFKFVLSLLFLFIQFFAFYFATWLQSPKVTWHQSMPPHKAQTPLVFVRTLVIFILSVLILQIFLVACEDSLAGGCWYSGPKMLAWLLPSPQSCPMSSVSTQKSTPHCTSTSFTLDLPLSPPTASPQVLRLFLSASSSQPSPESVTTASLPAPSPNPCTPSTPTLQGSSQTTPSLSAPSKYRWPAVLSSPMTVSPEPIFLTRPIFFRLISVNSLRYSLLRMADFLYTLPEQNTLPLLVRAMVWQGPPVMSLIIQSSSSREGSGYQKGGSSSEKWVWRGWPLSEDFSVWSLVSRVGML